MPKMDGTYRDGKKIPTKSTPDSGVSHLESGASDKVDYADLLAELPEPSEAERKQDEEDFERILEVARRMEAAKGNRAKSRGKVTRATPRQRQKLQRALARVRDVLAANTTAGILPDGTTATMALDVVQRLLTFIDAARPRWLDEVSSRFEWHATRRRAETAQRKEWQERHAEERE